MQGVVGQLLVKLCRKTFMHCGVNGAHLRGITGPAAPHTFAFDRRSDLPGWCLCYHVFFARARVWKKRFCFSHCSQRAVISFVFAVEWS